LISIVSRDPSVVTSAASGQDRSIKAFVAVVVPWQARDFVEGNLGLREALLRPVVFRRQDLRSDATSGGVVPSKGP
jgi:hypothetical protein